MGGAQGHRQSRALPEIDDQADVFEVLRQARFGSEVTMNHALALGVHDLEYAALPRMTASDTTGSSPNDPAAPDLRPMPPDSDRAPGWSPASSSRPCRQVRVKCLPPDGLENVRTRVERLRVASTISVTEPARTRALLPEMVASSQ